jgi:hypothetical protein
VLDCAEQANSVKLVLPQGDIDFVAAGTVTGIAPNERLDFRGHAIALEATEEILAKKLFYRAGLLKPRDALDLVAAWVKFTTAAQTAVVTSAPRREAQLKRLRALADAPPDQLSRDIAPIDAFREIIPTMISSALAWIARVDEMGGRPK